jgi:hypothetical protein
MALNPSGAISLAGPVAGQSIALELGLSPTAVISLNDTAVRTLAGVPSGAIIMPNNFWGKSNLTGTQRAIFGFGSLATSSYVSTTNLVSNTGVVSGDTPGVGTGRIQLAAASYGGDKAIFGFGFSVSPAVIYHSTTNLVSNTGVVAANTPGVGTGRQSIAAAGYGGDKALFGYGIAPASTYWSVTNRVSNTGVVSGDTPGVGTARANLAATGYGGDKAIFGFGRVGAPSVTTNITNLVSNTGVVAANTPGVGTARRDSAAAGYGGDKAIFGFGSIPVPGAAGYLSMTNLVSNTGVVATDTPGVTAGKAGLGAAGYGGDKAIFGFGGGPSYTPTPFNTNITNLVSNTGVVAANTPGVGSSRNLLAAAGYSST